MLSKPAGRKLWSRRIPSISGQRVILHFPSSSSSLSHFLGIIHRILLNLTCSASSHHPAIPAVLWFSPLDDKHSGDDLSDASEQVLDAQVWVKDRLPQSSSLTGMWRDRTPARFEDCVVSLGSIFGLTDKSAADVNRRHLCWQKLDLGVR